MEGVREEGRSEGPWLRLRQDLSKEKSSRAGAPKGVGFRLERCSSKTASISERVLVVIVIVKVL